MGRVVSRTQRSPIRTQFGRRFKRSCDCNWCASNRRPSRGADEATRDMLASVGDDDALGVLHPAEVRLIECDARERDDTCGEFCRGCASGSP
jgi:hypothetical protein